MKKISAFIGFVCLSLMLFSCSDFFETDSDRVVKTEDDVLNTKLDAFYAMSGVLHQLQKVGDSYVIFGELRGDLLDITKNSSQDLRDINNFEVSSDNSYLNEKDYYALINNCNYLINRIDTSIVVNKYKILKYEMAQAKSIRAWAYLQLCLDFGNVTYYEQPILDAETTPVSTEMKLDQLIETLIVDLLSWKPNDGVAEDFPDYGTIDNFASSKLFIPVRFMLGELYMWKNDYINAANMYYQVLLTNKLTVLDKSNKWNGNTFTNVSTRTWSTLFSDLSLGEIVSLVGYTTDYKENATLLTSMFQNDYLMAPSSAAIENWNSQVYSQNATVTTSGDLRGLYGSYNTVSESVGNGDLDYTRVTKYNNMSNYAIICRSSLLYLRYAEAVNRLGKPTLAFAVLKYGLNKEVLNSPYYISNKELKGESFIDFGQSGNSNIESIFKNNKGMHARGCGSVTLNNSYSIEAGSDTLTCVENMLVTEYALETAFEGNRFQDLMRIANHRNNPTYLAKMVGQKFPVGQREVIIAKLSDKNNWYLPRAK